MQLIFLLSYTKTLKDIERQIVSQNVYLIFALQRFIGCAYFFFKVFQNLLAIRKSIAYFCELNIIWRNAENPKKSRHLISIRTIIIMGFLDNLKNAEFTVAPNKKLKTISADFKNAFELTLVFYKGSQIADGDLTLAGLNKKTTKDVNTKADALKIKASTKVGEAEKMFDTAFGVTVQIKDASGKILVPNEITIGQAARGEYK